MTVPHMTETHLTMSSRKASALGLNAACSLSENLTLDLLPQERTKKRPTHRREIRRAIEVQWGKEFLLLKKRQKRLGQASADVLNKNDGMS